jgi:hypothetical protein
MESNKGKDVTEAQLQIERLKKMKLEKEGQEEKIKSEAFKYIDKPRTRTKIVRTVRLEKNNFDDIHKVVNRVNRKTKTDRLTKDKMINLLVGRFLEMEIDYTKVTNKASFIKLLNSIDIK